MESGCLKFVKLQKIRFPKSARISAQTTFADLLLNLTRLLKQPKLPQLAAKVQIVSRFVPGGIFLTSSNAACGLRAATVRQRRGPQDQVVETHLEAWEMSRRSRLSLGSAAFALAALLTSTSHGQQPLVPAPHKHALPVLPVTGKWHSPAVPRSRVGGMWMIDANFKSTIYIKNAVKVAPMTVTPILYLSNGKRLQLADVALEPAGIAVVNINQALADLGIAPWATLRGYVEIQYNWPWDALCVTVRNVDVAHSLVLTHNLRPAATNAESGTPDQLRIYEGLWWKQEPNVAAYVSVSNPSSSTNVEIYTSSSWVMPIARTLPAPKEAARGATTRFGTVGVLARTMARTCTLLSIVALVGTPLSTAQDTRSGPARFLLILNEAQTDISPAGVNFSSCALILPDGRFHLERRMQQLPSHGATLKLYDSVLDSIQLRQLQEISQ